MTLPPSGDQLEIAAAGYAAVVTESGATLRTLSYDGRPVVAGFADHEQATAGRGQLLLPWPNRVAGGRYRFGGRTHQLPLSEPDRGNASHGLVRWAAWRPVEQSHEAVTMALRLPAQSGYPWTLDLTARYALSAEGLEVTVTAANRAAAPAPFAAGAHPYLTVGDGPVDEWELDLAADTRLSVDDALIPVGREDVAGTELDFRGGRSVGGTVLDTAFTGLARSEDGRAEVTVRHGDRAVTLWMDRSHGWVQVFSGESLPEPERRRSLAVEPMTGPPNALVSGEDLLVLAPAGEPGDTLALQWGVRAG